MNLLEIFAAVTGALSVWLSVRQHIWSWPTAIVNVVAYTFVFHDAKLYADMALQVVYAVLSLYGWYSWLYGGAGRTPLLPTRVPPRVAVWLSILAITATGVIGTVLHRTTDAALPYVDSFLSSASLVAQWMMTRKLLEHWLVWITVDVLYVGMFVYKELYVTAALYAVFLALAARGYVEWRRTMSHAPASATLTA